MVMGMLQEKLLRSYLCSDPTLIFKKNVKYQTPNVKCKM